MRSTGWGDAKNRRTLCRRKQPGQAEIFRTTYHWCADREFHRGTPGNPRVDTGAIQSCDGNRFVAQSADEAP